MIILWEIVGAFCMGFSLVGFALYGGVERKNAWHILIPTVAFGYYLYLLA